MIRIRTRELVRPLRNVARLLYSPEHDRFRRKTKHRLWLALLCLSVSSYRRIIESIIRRVHYGTASFLFIHCLHSFASCPAARVRSIQVCAQRAALWLHFVPSKSYHHHRRQHHHHDHYHHRRSLAIIYGALRPTFRVNAARVDFAEQGKAVTTASFRAFRMCV